MRHFAADTKKTCFSDGLPPLTRSYSLAQARAQARALMPCLLVALAFLMQLSLRNFVSGKSFLFFYPAVIFAAVLGGLIPGLVATLMAALLSWVFFMPAIEWLETGVFLATGIAFAMLVERGRLSASAHPRKAASLPLEIGTGSPLEKTASAPATSSQESALPLVLVVEDDAMTNHFLAQSLSREFQVETAGDGADGLARALSLKPDVILTDIMMPKMSGDELVSEIRKHRCLDGTPIVLLTARADEELRARLLRNGAQDYVLKPFSPEEVHARVRNLVQVKRVREKLQRELESQLTDVETLASQLASRTQQLARALSIRDEILSIASHELKTPLTSLKLQLQITKNQIKPDTGTAPSPQTLDKSFSMSLKQVGSLVSLVDELLDVAKIQAGRLTLNLDRSDLCALLLETSERFSEDLKAHSCPLELDCDGDISGYWDRHRLEQVFVNLISNIIKYAPGQPAKITARKSDKSALVMIEDHGPGIPADNQTKIFERFERGQAGTNVHGLGLGLYVVKSIVEAHHGSISLESALGQGAKFTIRLPLNPTSLSH